jgi:amino-acid N-acetyltransferase
MSAEIRSRERVSLRDAQPADLPAVLALLGRAHLPTAGVADTLPYFVIAEDRGRIVGAVGLELYGASALLRSAAVEESWRGCGVGRTLIDRALEIARDRGIADVFLLTMTAEHYFPRFGFSCVSRESVTPEIQGSVEFQEACPASAVVMRKWLRG